MRCRPHNVWLVAVLCLDFLDLLTTYVLLVFFGGVEHNPFANEIFRAIGTRGGLVVFAIVKFSVIFGFWLFLAHLPKRPFIKFIDNFSKHRHEKFNFSYWRFLIHCSYVGAYVLLAHRFYVVAHNTGEIFTGLTG